MSWISTISKTIDTAFSTVRPALPAIPPILLLCEIARRPGLSAIALTAAIIKRLPEAGIPTGPDEEGKPNKFTQFVRIMSEEIVKEFKNNASISAVGNSGGVSVEIVGSSPTGPVTGKGTNTMPFLIKGLLQ